MRKKWFIISAIILIVVYCKGTLGLLSTDLTEKEFYLKFTALNILVTTLAVLSHHKKWDSNFLISCFSVMLFGFFIEVIGTKTGVIFGEYFYGKSLGIKLFNVPLIIGINWLLLIYIISGFLSFVNNIYVFSTLAAFIMTSLDYLIEPVAVKLDFWQWQNGIIPTQNYIAWFVISILLFYSFRKFSGRINNTFSNIVLSIQFAFFLTLNILLK
jgi:putative membrane protein